MKNDLLSLPLLLISNYDQMLTDEDAGILFKALISYRLGREDVTRLNAITILLYNQIILHLQAQEARAAALSATRAHAGRQGGRAKASNSQPAPEAPQPAPAPAPRRKTFTPPTPEELHTYMQTWSAGKGYTYSPLEADKFMAFYQSKQWMVGSNKMKDWQGAARNWLLSCERDRQSAAKDKVTIGREQVSTKTFQVF